MVTYIVIYQSPDFTNTFDSKMSSDHLPRIFITPDEEKIEQPRSTLRQLLGDHGPDELVSLKNKVIVLDINNVRSH